MKADYENIWGVEQKKLLFHHADLGSTNIKIMVDEDGTTNVTRLPDWESAEYFPKRWVSTKPHVSGGMDFDWNGEPDEWVWELLLSTVLDEMGYPSSGDGFWKWDDADLET